MTTVASAIINKARPDLQDVVVSPATDGVRYLNADLLGYLNDGQVEIANFKPPASITTAEVSLVAGYKQALPATGISPLRFGKNVTGGTIPTRTTPESLDMVIPDWQTHTANAKVTFVAYSPASPKTFQVYPPQPASTTQKLEISYYSIPAAVPAITANITLADEYVPALIDYVLHRAFGRNGEDLANLQRSRDHYNMFLYKLGLSKPPATSTRQQPQTQEAQ